MQLQSGTIGEFTSTNLYMGQTKIGNTTTRHFVNLTMSVKAEAGSAANTVNYYVKFVAQKNSGNPNISNTNGHMIGFAVTYDPATGQKASVSQITQSPTAAVLDGAKWINNTSATDVASASGTGNNGTIYLRITAAAGGTIKVTANGSDYTLFSIGSTKDNKVESTSNKNTQKLAAEQAAAMRDTTQTFTYTEQSTLETTQTFNVKTVSATNTSNSATDASDSVKLSGVSTKTGYFQVVKEDERIGTQISLPEEDLAKAKLTYYQLQSDGTYSDPLSGPPRNAGTYKVEASITAVSYTAAGFRVFTISKRPVTVTQIENWLRYVTTSEYAQLMAGGASVKLPVIDPKNPPADGDFSGTGVPGTIYLDNVVSGDNLTVTVSDAYYNNFTATYGETKITLTDVTLHGDTITVNNYTTESTQTVPGQISLKTQGVSLFLKTQTGAWRKYYGTDGNGAPIQVTPGNADYHSPATGELFLSHTEYVMARTVNKGERSTRYAVDIEFGAMQFNFYRSMWDVNELAYVELSDSNWVGMDGVNNHVALINYSNRPVWYQMSVELQKLQQDVGGTGRGITPKITSDKNGTAVVAATAWSEIAAATPGNINSVGTNASSERYLHLSGVPQLDSSVYVPVGVIHILVSPTGSNSA